MCQMITQPMAPKDPRAAKTAVLLIMILRWEYALSMDRYVITSLNITQDPTLVPPPNLRPPLSASKGSKRHESGLAESPPCCECNMRICNEWLWSSKLRNMKQQKVVLLECCMWQINVSEWNKNTWKLLLKKRWIINLMKCYDPNKTL
jgi:hypothetical protein